MRAFCKVLLVSLGTLILPASGVTAAEQKFDYGYRSEQGWLPYIGSAKVKQEGRPEMPVFLFQERDFGQGAVPEWRVARAKCPSPYIVDGLVYVYFAEDNTYKHTDGMHAYYLACNNSEIPPGSTRFPSRVLSGPRSLPH